ncbi:MAG: hypothetical protein ABSF76_16400 [Opitutaceae bacterium]|jgi:hypothetical protein
MAFALKLACIALATLALSAEGQSTTASVDSKIGEPARNGSQSAAERLGFSYTPLKNASEASVPFKSSLDAILMPKFMVNESRESLTEKNVLTYEGTLKIAKDRYISPLYRVTFGPLAQIAAYINDPLSILKGWHPSDSEAMALYRQDERLERLSELDSLIGLELVDSAKDTKEFQKLRSDASISSR